MLWNYQLTNFKAFAGPANIPIRPLTLIYGANSSGKSSIIQSLLMLKQTLEQAEDVTIPLLPQGQFVDLGNYKEFIYGHNLDCSFSFKADLRVDIYDLPETFRELLAEQQIKPPLVGLKVFFKYDRDRSQIHLESIQCFVGDDSESFITYQYQPSQDRSPLVIETLNSTHLIWKNFWKKSKKDIEKSFDGILKNALKSFSLKYPRSKQKKIAALEKLKNQFEQELVVLKHKSKKK
jgi:AAA15 family ATPase/GTPase